MYNGLTLTDFKIKDKAILIRMCGASRKVDIQINTIKLSIKKLTFTFTVNYTTAPSKFNKEKYFFINGFCDKSTSTGKLNSSLTVYV